MSIVDNLRAEHNTNSANYDAFGRARVSNTGQRLDLEFLYDKQPDFFDEITNGGSASVTHNTNPRDLTLTVGSTTNGEYATMRSHPVPYTPGNSQLIDITGVLDLANIGGGTAEVFIRSNITGSAVETTVEQSNWYNATSGVDWSDSHIFSVDFQSLKVGRIRYYLVQSGLPVFLTEITNDNVRDSGYWQLASLPVYWRIYNTATDTYMEMGYGDEDNAIGIRYKITANATATMKAICCTVKSEGGYSLSELPGLPRTATNGVTTVTASTTLVPILSIKPDTVFNSLANLVIALPKSFSVETSNPIRLAVVLGGTLGGGGTSWANADDSSVEFDVGSTTITGGKEIYSDYISSSARNRATSAQGLLGKTVLWDRQSSETGILTLAAVRTGASDAAVLATLNWEEIR